MAMTCLDTLSASMALSLRLSQEICAYCRQHHHKMTTAESCTGGLLSTYLTAHAGSSHSFCQGYIVYANDAKMTMLGVPLSCLEAHGAVSQQTAQAMAQGALAHARADIAISITGIAGPSGGSAGKPVGTVYMALIVPRETEVLCQHHHITGSRAEIRQQAAERSLRMVHHYLHQP